MQKQSSYYMVIPASVWSNPNFTKTHIVLYGHISTMTNQKGYCWASNSALAKLMNASERTISRLISELVEFNVLHRTIIYVENTKEVKERKLYITDGFKMNSAIDKDDNRPIDTDVNRPVDTDVYSPIDTDDHVNSKSINSKNINITDKNVDDVRKNLFWKGIVPRYPTNRLGNRQHNLKKWMKLSDAEMKMAITNIERYLTLANGFVKTLGNYIEEKCFTDEWLNEQEKVNKKKNQDTNTSNTAHNFSRKYY